MTDYSICPKCGGIIKGGFCNKCETDQKWKEIGNKIYCTGCKQYLKKDKFAPSMLKLKSCRCSACETNRVRFHKEKTAILCKRKYEE